MGSIVGIAIGLFLIVTSMPHSEYLDLGVATGTIDVETNIVGIILGVVVLIISAKSIK